MTERETDRRPRLEQIRLERKRRVLLLAEAIDGADRWYAEREAELRAFDRRTAATVAQLVAEGRVAPTMAWSPAGVSHSRGRDLPGRAMTSAAIPHHVGPRRATEADTQRRRRTSRPIATGAARTAVASTG